MANLNPSSALGSFDLELRRGVRADPPSISHESAVNLYFLIVGCNHLDPLIILGFVSHFYLKYFLRYGHLNFGIELRRWLKM